MTEITAPKSPITTAEFADEIREQLKYTQGVTVEQATPADVYVAASTAVRRHLMDSWMKTQQDMVNGNTKAVGYLSAEFLMGKQLIGKRTPVDPSRLADPEVSMKAVATPGA